jgi:hypothetical protein
MSIPSHTDEPAGPPPGGRAGSKLMKAAAAAAAAAALLFGAQAIAGGNASTSTADAASGTPARPFAGRPGLPGFGADVTGDTLSKLKQAVAARYPGTVERAMKLPDGSYVVHVIGSNGQESHVHVAKDFKVLGADRGGPGRFGGRGFGAAVTGATLSRLKAAVAAKYPGTVERAMKLPDGSYEVHVIRSNGQEVHVQVSKDFAVTGAERGGPPPCSPS